MIASLYFHIPFCRSKCSYCDFFSVGYQGNISDEYLQALINELSYRVKQSGIDSVHTVYLGGGTPGLLTDSQFFMLFSSLKEVIPGFAPEEITVEANPADITEPFLSTIRKCGVNRLSVGIQTLDDQVLRSLNRRSDAECIQHCLDLLGNKWVGNNTHLSLDFISGLPGLSDEVFLKGLSDGYETGADHISLYALTLEAGTALYREVQSGKTTVDDDQNDRQWELGADFLRKKGYTQYEVSNFSLPGCHSKHNCTYWHMNPYLGIGAGGTGTVGSYRWTNTNDIKSYIEFWNSVNHENRSLPEQTELLDDEIRETEFLMMGFRLLEGVSSHEYYRRFGRNLSERLSPIWNQWEEKKLAQITITSNGDSMYALTLQGILLLNRFLLEIL